MNLTSLTINNIRNIGLLNIKLNPQFNMFFGPNGSGKTSVLEAIHLLLVGRSFRTRHSSKLINHNHPECIVTGEFTSEDSPNITKIGIKKTKSGDFQAKINGEACSLIADLASQVPVQIINSDSLNLILGGPEQRRQLIDWILFHVEPKFLAIWQQFRNVIKQRNAALKSGNRIRRGEVAAWDQEFVILAEQIDNYRKLHVEQYKICLQQILISANLPACEVSYNRGWNPEISMHEALVASINNDIMYGYTTCGPQRADLAISVDSIPAKHLLSRGQIKLVACAMLLARAELLQKQHATSCILLIDDLPAELDVAARKWLLDTLRKLGLQVLITAVTEDSLVTIGSESTNVFHVEQGTINI